MLSILLSFGMFATASQEGPRPPRPTPAAMLLDVKGKVGLRLQAGTTSAAHVGDLIYPGEQLTVPADGSATLAILGAGAQEVLKPGVEATIGPKGAEPPEAIARRVEQRRALAATMKNLTPASSDSRKAAAVFRSRRESTRAINPIFGSVVVSDHPPLAWPAVEGVKSYRVRLFVQGSDREIWKGETKDPKAILPESLPSLQRGSLYGWAVADQDFRPLFEGEFSVATGSELQQIEEARAAEGGDRADRLAAALAYRRLGAYAEALAGFEKLAADSPEEPLYREMLAEMRDLAGRQAAGAR